MQETYTFKAMFHLKEIWRIKYDYVTKDPISDTERTHATELEIEDAEEALKKIMLITNKPENYKNLKVFRSIVKA